MKFTSETLYHDAKPMPVSNELLKMHYSHWFDNIICSLKIGEFKDTDFNRITRIA